MWFTETPWPPVAICVIVAVLLYVLLFHRNPKGTLAAIAALAAAAVAIVIIERQIVTDRERVEQSVRDIVSNFAAGDADATNELISAQAQALRMLVAANIRLVTVHDYRISDYQTRLTNENSRAVTRFRVNATIGFLSQPPARYPSRWELLWQKEGGEWRALAVRRLDVLQDREVDLRSRGGGPPN